MIPKVIHYFWFGKNKKNSMICKCIESWKNYCPDYKIIEWNEDNFNINSNEFVKKAIEAKKWALATDVARLQVIYEFGGIYLDTDVELIKSLNSLLNEKAFMGFEDGGLVATGLGFGAEKGNSIIKENLDQYNTIEFKNDVNYLLSISCPQITTNVLLRRGLISNNTVQIIDGVKVLSTEYLCPMNKFTRKLSITDNTISIHHYEASWLNTIESKLNMKKDYFNNKYGPEEGYLKYKKWYKNRKIYIAIRRYGFKECIKRLFNMKERSI